MFELHFEPPRTPEPTRDWCNKEGAIALKAQIESYWVARGYAIQVWIEEKPYSMTMRGNPWVVRSNIGKNGLPPSSSVSERAA